MKYWQFSNGDQLVAIALKNIGTAKYHDIMENINTQYPEMFSKISHYFPRQKLDVETDIQLTYKDGKIETLVFHRKKDDFFFMGIG
jgi:hypothetical protein